MNIKKYWLEILTVIVIAVGLIICQAPDMTWVNTDSDGIHYTYSAEHLYPSHKGSAPLYLLLGNLFLKIPLGTEFWRMALISVLSGVASCIFIILIIRKELIPKNILYILSYQILKNGTPVNKNARYYSIIGALIYGGSALAISQNTIVESYPLVTAVCLAIYYFCLKEKWLTASILIGGAGAIHPTAMLVIIPMLVFYKPLRTWRRLGVMALFVLFYLYVPLTNRPPYMWNVPNSEGLFGFIKDSLSTAWMLTGKLFIGDLPKRLLDTGGLVLLNLSAGIIPLILYFKEDWRKNPLFWIIIVPTVYFIADVSPQTYVYLQPSIAFGAIAVGIGLAKINIKWMYATAACSIILLVFNFNYFDIGRTLDKNLSATRYYEEELAKVPDGQILMPYYGWEWAAIFKYNKELNRNIIPVCIDTLVSEDYQKLLDGYGVKYADNKAEDRVERQNYIALSIIELNENVWTTQVTDASTYGCAVVPAVKELLIKVPDEPPGMWHWKPSNPYDMITGSIEITEWRFITMSNHNVLFVSLLGIVGYYAGELLTRVMRKRKVVVVK